MMAGSEARDGAETGDGSPSPSSSSDPAATPTKDATVVITASSLETECFVRASGEDAAGGRKVLVEQKQQGKGGVGVADTGACVVVDVEEMDGGGDREHEKVCRICHLSPDHGEEESELVQLGCRCKGELGIAHTHCAEAWFRLKGNRYCEICGANAKNITGEEDGSFMEEWHEGRRVLSSRGNNISSSSSQRGGGWRGQSFCNFLMACLVIAFILPWFFRINIF